MSRTIVVRPLRVLLLSAFIFLLAVLTHKFAAEYTSSHERGRFVVSIMNGQLQRFALIQNQAEGILNTARGWPDDSIALQSWITTDLLKFHDPSVTMNKLAVLSGGRSISPTLNASIGRWRDTLQRWTQWRASNRGEGHASALLLLEEGRRRHYQAVGYQRIGRGYDATVLYLWSADALAKFIEQEPLSGQVPEALYMLGETFVRLRRALPEEVRVDRILNLCGETYPETVWATQAASLWKDELGNEV